MSEIRVNTIESSAESIILSGITTFSGTGSITFSGGNSITNVSDLDTIGQIRFAIGNEIPNYALQYYNGTSWVII